MESPLDVIVRKVAYDHDVMRLFPTAPEIPVKHDPGAWPNRLHPGPCGTRDIEALNDDVMCRLQQYHPIRIAWGRTIDNAVARFAEGFEMNVTAVTSVRFIAHHEPGIRPRHYRDEIAASRRVGCLLQCFVNFVDGIQDGYSRPFSASCVEFQCINTHALLVAGSAVHQQHAAIPPLDVQRPPHPLVGVLSFVKDGRWWRLCRSCDGQPH